MVAWCEFWPCFFAGVQLIRSIASRFHLATSHAQIARMALHLHPCRETKRSSSRSVQRPGSLTTISLRFATKTTAGATRRERDTRWWMLIHLCPHQDGPHLGRLRGWLVDVERGRSRQHGGRCRPWPRKRPIRSAATGETGFAPYSCCLSLASTGPLT